MGRRKGKKGVSDKKRVSFLASAGIQSGTSSEPAQSSQAKADGEAVLRANILARMNGQGSGYETSYKSMAVSVKQDPGLVKALMDGLVSDGLLYKTKGRYGTQ